MQAVVLAGGLGTRLKDITRDIYPKPMVPINTRWGTYPLLEFVLGNLFQNGIEDYTFLVGHKSEQIVEHFERVSQGRLKMQFVPDRYKGTASCLKDAEELLDEQFYLVCGDVYAPIDFVQLSSGLESSLCVLSVLEEKEDSSTISNVGMDIVNRVTKYSREGVNDVTKHRGVETGTLALQRKVLEFIPKDVPGISLTDHIYSILIENNELSGAITKEEFYDVGTPEKYHAFCDYVNKNNIKPITELVK